MVSFKYFCIPYAFKFMFVSEQWDFFYNVHEMRRLILDVQLTFHRRRSRLVADVQTTSLRYLNVIRQNANIECRAVSQNYTGFSHNQGT